MGRPFGSSAWRFLLLLSSFVLPSSFLRGRSRAFSPLSVAPTPSAAAVPSTRPPARRPIPAPWRWSTTHRSWIRRSGFTGRHIPMVPPRRYRRRWVPPEPDRPVGPATTRSRISSPLDTVRSYAVTSSGMPKGLEQFGIRRQRRRSDPLGIRCATFTRAAGGRSFPPLPFLSRLALPVEVFPESAPEPDIAIFARARLLQGYRRRLLGEHAAYRQSCHDDGKCSSQRGDTRP